MATAANLARERPAQPRLRVLAGPNGSGKSTIKPDLHPLWTGPFINADEIEAELKASQGRLELHDLGIGGEAVEVLEHIRQSLQAFGLGERLDLPDLLEGMTLDAAMTLWVPGPYNSYLAAALADAVRQKLLDEGLTFTFETVMSHRSKIAFMQKARERGYRVYLYFVATDDPAINIDRVRRRVLQDGHPVAPEKIIERYHKSIALMPQACEVAHRAYLFDNSGFKHKLLAEVTDFETMALKASVINPWLAKSELFDMFAI